PARAVSQVMASHALILSPSSPRMAMGQPSDMNPSQESAALPDRVFPGSARPPERQAAARPSRLPPPGGNSAPPPSPRADRSALALRSSDRSGGDVPRR